MDQGRISDDDRKAVRLLGYMADTFEAEMGFALPGISASMVPEHLAERFGAGTVDDGRLSSLAKAGLLRRVPGPPGYYIPA